LIPISVFFFVVFCHKKYFFANVAKIFLTTNFLIFVVVKKNKEKKEKSKEKI
jgi:hypothetical protein